MKGGRRLIRAWRRQSRDVGVVVVAAAWRAGEDEFGDAGVGDEEGEAAFGDELDGELGGDATEAELEERGDEWSI